MSIVKQIVDLSGGTIDIRSELGQGTEIKLSLPLENCLSDSKKMLDNSQSLYLEEDSIHTVRRRARSRTVTIRGFETSGKSHLQQTAVESFKASIEKYITQWFNLTIADCDEAVDIVVSDESAFASPMEAPGNKPKLLLILCSNGSRREIYTARSSLAQHVEFVSKPCGPHRLAKALLNCLDKEDAFQKANAARSSIGFSPTTINLDRAPVLQPNAQASPNSRPQFMHRMSSENGQLSSESNNGSSNITSVTSSTSATSNSSSSRLLNGTSNTGLVFNSEPVFARPLKMLLVEDNPINMMLLATYMKKNKWDYETANNGLVALQAFQKRPQGFDIILMDVSMPIMTGYESTRAIRNVETERRLDEDLRWEMLSPAVSSPLLFQASPSFPFPTPDGISSSSAGGSTADFDLKIPSPLREANHPALIIALTGFSSQKDQEMAFESGVDIFMTKPVRFKEVGRILSSWLKTREMENQTANDILGKGEKERRELDETTTGAKRSG